jgi:hypothetical protein
MKMIKPRNAKVANITATAAAKPIPQRPNLPPAIACVAALIE